MITFCRNRKHCQNVRTTDKPRKYKIYDSGTEKQFQTKYNRSIKTKKIIHLKELNILNI